MMERVVAYVRYDDRTWEPFSSFEGSAAKDKAAAFLAEWKVIEPSSSSFIAE